VTDTTAVAGMPPAAPTGEATRSGPAAMNVAQLKAAAAALGITGTTKMRKSDLVAAIAARRSGGVNNGRSERAGAEPRRARRSESVATHESSAPPSASAETASAQSAPAAPPSPTASAPTTSAPPGARRPDEQTPQERPSTGPPDSREQDNRPQDNRPRDNREQDDRDQRDHRDRQQNRQQHPGQNRQGAAEASQARQGGQGGQGGQGARNDQNGQGNGQDTDRAPGAANQASRYDDDTDGRGGRRRNRQRSRDRKRSGRPTSADGQDDEPELLVNDDDVLVPVAGILDVLDNYAFVRTSGYLPGPNDVYVPLGVVKRNGLRKGDAVTGAVKALREGEQPQGSGANRQKFNALVRLDSVNGQTAEQSRTRVEFGKLTPLYPQERLRLETEPNILTTRIIDLIAPIGKGQRGLIVAPSKAGKTMVMQAIANAITANNPECHLMVVLVDERPEEVTDMQRAVKGEVISSTFDRPADDHTTVAELAIERAKRLVEMGHDVVVLLDSITKLGRAYNLSAPASGRILSGGVDSAALYPPKKFFGAARNIENGGSLTILATALVETGSRMDEVIFEEFKGTGNMELRLSRELANRRIFPAVDVNASSTRREEILLGAEELKIMWKLRRVLAALDSQQGIELLLDRLKKTRSNVEFLRQVQMTASSRLDGDED